MVDNQMLFACFYGGFRGFFAHFPSFLTAKILRIFRLIFGHFASTPP